MKEDRNIGRVLISLATLLSFLVLMRTLAADKPLLNVLMAAAGFLCFLGLMAAAFLGSRS